MNKQTTVDTASKKIGGQAPATGKRVPTDLARKSGPVGEPDSVKGGHDSVKAGSRSIKGGHD